MASWINITEQWPFRTSWLILYYDMYEDTLDDNMSLKSLYDKYVASRAFISFSSLSRVTLLVLLRVRPQIPVLKEVQPLLEMDRDERKLDVFLTFHRARLLVSDMKIFLPFTINLDPYIKKKIKEEQQSAEEDVNFYRTGVGSHSYSTPLEQRNKPGMNRYSRMQRQPSLQGSVPPAPSWVFQPNYDWNAPWMHPIPPMEPLLKPQPAVTNLPVRGSISCELSGSSRSLSIYVPQSEITETELSSLSVSGVCELLDKISNMNRAHIPVYKQTIKESNINGRVLLNCDLSGLKKVTFIIRRLYTG